LLAIWQSPQLPRPGGNETPWHVRSTAEKGNLRARPGENWAIASVSCATPSAEIRAMSLRMSAGSIGDNSRTSGLIVVAISLGGRRSLASISLVDHDPVTSISDVTN
jgi:hypothetical protein